MTEAERERRRPVCPAGRVAVVAKDVDASRRAFGHCLANWRRPDGVVRCECGTRLGKTLRAWRRGRWLAKGTEVARVGRFACSGIRRTVLIHHALTLHIGQNPRPPGFDAVKRSLRQGATMRQRLDGLREQAGTTVGHDCEDHLT